jgi:hypothetical protein
MAEERDPQNPPIGGPKDIPPDRTGRVTELSVHDFLRFSETVESAISRALPNALQKLGYTEEVAGLVQLLAARSNDTTEDVLRKALNLYGLALDAREKGNRMAILDPDDVIVHEVVGFEPAAV